MAAETFIVDEISRVRFASPDSRFVILQLESGIAALGDMATPLTGERIKFYGTESVHEKYGRQFKFTRFERQSPVGLKAVRDYLCRVAKWVGPTVADRIVTAYGDATLAVLKTEPERVAREIRGITQKRAEEIAEELRGREQEEQLVLQLGELCSGRVPDNVMRAAKDRWGGDAPRMIRENPYLLTGLWGCGFKGADRVAEGLGIKGADPRRLAAALEYALKTEAGRGGHTRLSIDEGERLAGELANCPLTPEGIALALKAGVVRGADYYALARYEQAEQAVAAHLQRLIVGGKELPHDAANLESCAADQTAAFGICFGAPVSLLVGAPGTGKTWTLARIVEAYRGGKGNRIALAAPTGKAAKRMTESLAATCGGTACTIHRLLEPSKFDKGSGERMRFTRCEANPIEADLLVVDETSMLDVELASELLSAVPSGCRVIFIGDDNQLPSVGPGAVLRDMLAAELPTARLTEIKRNAGEIVRACHAIKDGKAPAPNPKPLDLEGGHNWRHVEIPTEREIAEQIVWLVTEWARAKAIPADEIMVVSPFNHLNERELSCRDFNERLQAALNPASAVTSEPARGGIREGDRVVRLSNGMAEETLGDWEVPIVNGDLGRVTKLEKHSIFVTFENPTRRVKLARKDADLALAYALSCHKMQGSEARVIIVPLHKSFGIFPNREWVYTAFSRAKQILITVGTVATIGAWARRQTNGLRKTGLVTALRAERERKVP